ncbi:MAG: iron-containing alcohol dehydrogenase [Rhodobacteraceae bacterium]|nr:iron-containing alcohol dehydrogenase [Paracoccaceae bacterium]
MNRSSFSFSTAGEILFGRGCSDTAPARIAQRGRNVLLVRGGNGARSAWLRAALEQLGCNVVEFAVAHEPDLPLVSAGTLAARGGTQVVVGLGGGAVIDTAKAIAALAPAHRPILDHLEVVGQGLPLEVPPLPVVAIPTTAGTGAEVTRNAVITVAEHRRKVSLRDPAMLPALAIVDPALTDGTPRAITLASGLDAVTQVIEPYISSRANPMTDALCRSAIAPGLAALRQLIDTGEDARARDALAWTSLCGGLALANAGLGVVHGLAGPLGGLSGAAHGAICGALLPHGLAANAARASDPELLARLDDVRGWIVAALGGAPQDAFATLAQWTAQAGLAGLHAQGVSDADAHLAAQSAATSSSMKANPVVLDARDLAQVMAAAW